MNKKSRRMSVLILVDRAIQKAERKKSWSRIPGLLLFTSAVRNRWAPISLNRGRWADLQLECLNCVHASAKLPCKYSRTQKHIQIWMCLHGKASVFKILFKSPRIGIISGELYLLVGAILNSFMYFSPCHSLKFFIFFPFGL